jgi:hypothetical protein
MRPDIANTHPVTTSRGLAAAGSAHKRPQPVGGRAAGVVSTGGVGQYS